MLRQEESSYQLLRCRTRGSWVDASFQLYGTKDDEARTAADMGDWAFLGFKSSRNLLAQRMSRHDADTATSARLFNVIEPTAKEFLQKNRGIRRLDVSRSSLETLPTELVNSLPHLQRLNLSSNDLADGVLAAVTSVPATGASGGSQHQQLQAAAAAVASGSQMHLSSLIELDLTNNLLRRLPAGLRDAAPRLSRLYVGYNDIESLAGVETLSGLVLLDAECNLIKAVDWEALADGCRRLQVLRLQYNQIASVERRVRYMRELRELSLAHNSLQQVPVDVFFLPALECLDLSHNAIPRIETAQVTATQGFAGNTIASVDLSGNQLTRMPEFLLLVASRLDLSSNMIAEVPGNILKHMDFKTQQVLELKDNPVRLPPYEVCQSGLGAMIKFYQHLKLTTPYYQGMKALVLGNKGVGKTSLVRNIVEEHPHLAGTEEETMFCDITEVTRQVTPGGDSHARPLSVSFWDFAGDARYHAVMHPLVDAEAALVLLTFNMATYRTAEFYKNFGVWLDYLLSKSGQIKLIPVGTHCDLLNETTIRKIAAEVGGKIVTFVEQRKAELQRRMDEIEQLPVISSYLQAHLKHISSVLSCCVVHLPQHGRAVPVSCKTGAGVQKLMAEVSAMTDKKLKLFPRVLNIIPSLWNEVADSVAGMGRAMSVPLVTWDKFQSELTERHGLKNVMMDVAKHLHESGHIVWMRDHKSLSKFVVLRPLWLASVMKNLLGYGTKAAAFTEIEDLCLRRGVTKTRYGKYVEDFVEQGRADAEFLQCLWSKECPVNASGSDLLVEFLCGALEYAYPIERPSPRARDALLQQPSLSRVFPDADGGDRLLRDAAGKRRADAGSVGASTSAELVDSAKKNAALPPGAAGRKHRDAVGGSTGGGAPEQSELRPDSRASSVTVSSRSTVTRRSHGHVELKETQLPTLLVPTLRSSSQDDVEPYLQERDSLAGRESIDVGYRFALYTPPGLFGRICVRLTQRRFALQYAAVWSSGLYARIDDGNCRLLLELASTEAGGSSAAPDRCDDVSGDAGVAASSTGSVASPLLPTQPPSTAAAELRVKLVSLSEGAYRKQPAELWKLLLPILGDCEELFAEYAGLYVERYARCPHCKQDAFRGEWTAPKDMQAAAAHQCGKCQASVAAELIIQPMERKAEDVQRVFSELKKRRQSSKAEKRKETSKQQQQQQHRQFVAPAANVSFQEADGSSGQSAMAMSHRRTRRVMEWDGLGN